MDGAFTLLVASILSRRHLDHIEARFISFDEAASGLTIQTVIILRPTSVTVGLETGNSVSASHSLGGLTENAHPGAPRISHAVLPSLNGYNAP